MAALMLGVSLAAFVPAGGEEPLTTSPVEAQDEGCGGDAQATDECVEPETMQFELMAIPSVCDLADMVHPGESKQPCEAIEPCALSGTETRCSAGGDDYILLGRSYRYRSFGYGHGHQMSWWGKNGGGCDEGWTYKFDDLGTVPRPWSSTGHWDNIMRSHKAGYNGCDSILYDLTYQRGSSIKCQTDTDCTELGSLDRDVSSLRFR